MFVGSTEERAARPKLPYEEPRRPLLREEGNTEVLENGRKSSVPPAGRLSLGEEKLERRPLRLERGVAYRCGFAAGTAVVIGYAGALDVGGEAAGDGAVEGTGPALTWGLPVLLVDVVGESAGGNAGV